jgi:hypothetical protein
MFLKTERTAAPGRRPCLFAMVGICAAECPAEFAKIGPATGLPHFLQMAFLPVCRRANRRIAADGAP